MDTSQEQLDVNIPSLSTGNQPTAILSVAATIKSIAFKRIIFF